jgi:hypothetical protein
MLQFLDRSSWIWSTRMAVAVYVREYEAVKVSVNDRHTAIHIGIFLGHYSLTQGTMRFRAPAPSGIERCDKKGLYPGTLF